MTALLLLLACGSGTTETAETGLPAYVTTGTPTSSGTTTPSGTPPTTPVTLDPTGATATWIGTNPSFFLNYAAPLGDVDGDGTTDHLLQNIESLTQFSGWVISGATTGTGSVDQLALAHLDVQTSLHPDFGAAGDVDGDGLADLSVSDQQSPATVYLITGTVTGTVDPYPLAFATAANLWTTRPWADVDGDGAAEWLGIERDNAFPDVQQVHLIPGGLTGPIDVGSAALATLELPTIGGLESALAERVERIDLDGDGVPELLASDYRYGPFDTGGISQIHTGRVLAWPTPLSGTLPISAAILDIAPDDGEGWMFGYDLATGDLDGDGSIDLAVAARGQTRDGGVWAFFDPMGSTTLSDADATLAATPTGLTLGVGVAELSGFPGDDLAVRYIDGPGALLVFESPAGTLDADDARVRIVGAGPTDLLASTGTIGDNVVLGAAGAASGAGEIYLFGAPL